MKILHVSNFSMRWDACNFWGIPYKLTNGFIRQGHHVINFSDRDIANSFFIGIRMLGVGPMNAKLIRVCREVKPDLLLLGHCIQVWEKTVAAIREELPGIRVAHWNCDPLLIPENLAHLRRMAPLVDATFVTTAGEQLGWVSQAGRAAFIPNPVDPSIESLRIFEKEETENELVYCTRYNPEKIEIAELIRKELPDLKFDCHGLFGRPEIHGAAMFETLARAKMGLNTSRHNSIFLYSSDRMSLLMGNGLLTFIDSRTRFDTLFADDELVSYESGGDLIEKLKFFRKNDSERRLIAERGWKRAHALFNGTRVAKYIGEVTFGEKLSEDYGWPV